MRRYLIMRSGEETWKMCARRRKIKGKKLNKYEKELKQVGVDKK